MLLQGLTPLLGAVHVGALHKILNKSDRYNLFDHCKVMAHIALDEDTNCYAISMHFVP